MLVPGDYDRCEVEARRAAARSGATFVHSFDDTVVIDGHRSLFREVDAQSGAPDVVFVPVGGGGLVTAAIREWGDRVRIVGVEYDRAPVMQRCLDAGRFVEADRAVGMPEGLLVRRIGRIAFRECRQYGLTVVTVGDTALRGAMRLLWRELGIRAEGAGAAALAAALAEPDPSAGALCVVSGGNIDDALWTSWVTDPTPARATAG